MYLATKLEAKTTPHHNELHPQRILLVACVRNTSMHCIRQRPDKRHCNAQTRSSHDTTRSGACSQHEMMMRLKQACSQGYPESAVYVQIPIGSRNSAIHNAYHTSLRPSSLFEPRHPSLKVVRKLSNSLTVNAKEKIQKHKDWSKTVTAGQAKKPTPDLPPPRPREGTEIPKRNLTFGDSSEVNRCV